jgi:hypothetical protein
MSIEGKMPHVALDQLLHPPWEEKKRTVTGGFLGGRFPRLTEHDRIIIWMGNYLLKYSHNKPKP